MNISAETVVFWITVLGAVVAFIKEISKLSSNITLLTASIQELYKQSTELKNTVDSHEVKINNHEVRISVMEHDNDKN